MMMNEWVGGVAVAERGYDEMIFQVWGWNESESFGFYVGDSGIAVVVCLAGLSVARLSNLACGDRRWRGLNYW